jgi:tetratricopeptide (TPR) repeat protein
MSKRVLVTAAVAASVLAVATLYGLLLRGILLERGQQASLEEQIELVATALAAQQEEGQALPTRQAELEAAQSDLAAVEGKLVAARLAFPSELDSTEVLADVISAAAIHRTNLRRVQAREPVTVTIESSTYRLLAYDVAVEGTLDAVSAFLVALESGPIGTMSLDNIHLQAPPTPAPTLENATPIPTPTEGPPLYQVSLVVQVYLRQMAPGSTTGPPAGTPASAADRVQELKALLEQARQTEDWERIISLLLALRQLDPSDLSVDGQLVEAYAREGQRRLAAGQYEQAATNFRAALALQPDNAEALAGVAALAALTPTPTATPTLQPTPTSTPTPTATRKPANTPKPAPTATPTVTPMTVPYYVLNLSFGANSRYPDLGCKWFGFAGRVTGSSGYPLAGIRLHVWAPGWDGVWTTTSASGDYEFYLDNHPRQERWLVQVYEGEQAASEALTVDSRADCSAAVIQLDWRRRY